VRQYAALAEDVFPSGVYHMTAGGSASWCEFARAIVAALSESETFRLKRILGIPSSEYPTLAQRPMNSVLCNGKFERTFGFRLGSWQMGLAEVIHELRLRESNSLNETRNGGNG
jgi:dTDP-4-dehydrorhamnose reductase